MRSTSSSAEATTAPAWGRRVELNAFTSDQFIAWLEAKLDEHGVEKVIPDDETLALQYRRSLARHAVNKKIDEIRASVRAEADDADIPDDLAARVRDLLEYDPAMSWDDAVTQIVAVDTDERWVMTWTRLDDRWAERAVLAQLSYETRWHYLAMIQFCSRERSHRRQADNQGRNSLLGCGRAWPHCSGPCGCWPAGAGRRLGSASGDR